VLEAIAELQEQAGFFQVTAHVIPANISLSKASHMAEP
jgi:hypothetical protein